MGSSIKSNATRKYFPKRETIAIESHQIKNFKNDTKGYNDNKTSRKDTVDARYNRGRGHLSSVSYQESVSRPSTSVTLTIYSDEEETPKVPYIKPELKDKNKNIEEERKAKVTYNIRIEQFSSHEVNSLSLSNYRTNNQKDVELSLTPAIVDPTTTPMELLEVETSLQFTEKTFPVDSLGELLFIFLNAINRRILLFFSTRTLCFVCTFCFIPDDYGVSMFALLAIIIGGIILMFLIIITGVLLYRKMYETIRICHTFC